VKRFFGPINEPTRRAAFFEQRKDVPPAHKDQDAQQQRYITHPKNNGKGIEPSG
jgi:hypothetical protein